MSARTGVAPCLVRGSVRGCANLVSNGDAPMNAKSIYRRTSSNSEHKHDATNESIEDSRRSNSRQYHEASTKAISLERLSYMIRRTYFLLPEFVCYHLILATSTNCSFCCHHHRHLHHHHHDHQHVLLPQLLQSHLLSLLLLLRPLVLQLRGSVRLGSALGFMFSFSIYGL